MNDKGDDNLKGLECPRCGCRGPHTCYSHRKHGQFIRRIRVCRHCGMKFGTRERAEPLAPGPDE